jgi:hypothetical protein
MIPERLSRERSGVELIGGFYQHGAGNCASIAVIKCAIAAFGKDPVYRHAVVDGDVVGIELRDGLKLRVTASELELASRRSFFAGEDKELLAHAHFLFAVMAKRAQMEGNDGRQGLNFSEAIDTLNDGEFWLEAPTWLGLEPCVKLGPNRKLPAYGAAREFLSGRPYGIGKSAQHVWFASMGVHDEYGTPSDPRWSISGAMTLDPSKG